MTVVGAAAVEMVIPRIAAQIKELRHQGAVLTTEVEKLVDDLPLSQVLISIPRVGIKTTSTILLSIGDGSTFKDAAHPAAYAGIAPTSRHTGTSIHGEHPSRSGNKALKNALFRSA